MKRNLYICLIIFTLMYLKAEAQTAQFALVPGSLSTQIKGKANDSLSLYYKVTYLGDWNNSTFSGWIYTKFITNNDTNAWIANDSFNTEAQIPHLVIQSGDTVGIYCHIIVKRPYFNNGKGNLVVVWPTGARQSNKSDVVPCADTFHYAMAVTISGLSGINENNDPFNLLSIYPNPTNTILNIQNNNPGLVLKLARVMDYAGREVMIRKSDFEKLDVSALKPGTYFLELSAADGDKTVYTFIISR